MFKVGDKVTFDRGEGFVVDGEITAINLGKATVKPIKGGRWVSFPKVNYTPTEMLFELKSLTEFK